MPDPNRFTQTTTLEMNEFRDDNAVFSNEQEMDRVGFGLLLTLPKGAWRRLGTPLSLSVDVDVRTPDA
jgi:hypothetical protein